MPWCFVRLGLLSILFAGCTSSSSTPASAEFEGIITFKTRLIAKMDVIDEAALNAAYGDTLRFYYSQGRYRLAYNGTGIRNLIYDPDTQTEYTLRNGIDTLFTVDTTHETRPLDTLYVADETKLVAGRSCTLLVKKIKGARHTYCFDPSLPIDPQRFAPIKYAHADQMYALMEALYINYTYESGVFIIERRGLSVEQRPLPDTIFAIPDLPQTPIAP